jgi:Concanavalin A-like lectin/glucanases superfamily
MRRAAVLVPLVLSFGCYDWTLPSGPAPSDAASDAGSDGGSDVDAGPGVEAGLVAWWRFDEAGGTAIADSSGHGNDGKASASVTRVPGIVRGAVQFDGVDGFIHVDDNGTLVFPNGLTVAMWMNVADVSYDQRVIETFTTWGIKLNRRHPQLRVGDKGYATLLKDLPVSEWHHVAFTYDGGKGAGYFDGQPALFGDTTLVTAANPASSSNGLNIGASFQASIAPADRTEQPYWVNGALDEIRVYDRALAPEDVLRIYQTR